MGKNDMCLICKERPSTKKNSHIIPSFLLAPIFSYDGSSKRGGEVMFTITPTEEKVYIGELPDTKIESLFDTQSLTDERIDSELKVNTAAKDYIFCPKCEADLSKYLESEYSSMYSKGMTGIEVPYFFWLSVIWRIAVSGQFGVTLPQDISDALQECLKRYFIAKDSESDIQNIIQSCPFSYRLLRCPGFINSSPAYVLAEYDRESSCLTVMIGEVIICASFHESFLNEAYTFFGAEGEIKNAPLNDGSNEEVVVHIDTQFFSSIVSQTVTMLAKQKAMTEYELMNCCWRAMGMPYDLPGEIFQRYMEYLLDEESKIGDRMTNERRVECFNMTLEEFGFKFKEE